jgi:hypothetical protein
MKLWIDDVREPPKGYVWCKSVGQAKQVIRANELRHEPIELLDMDHDSGDYAFDGGDYIKLLDWMEFTNRNYPIRIHSMNPVGRENMRAIIRRNGWTEVK